MATTASFDELVDEANAAPITGWDFSWLDGRAVEDRPTWHYFDRIVERVSGVVSMLDVQTGGGSMIEQLPSIPQLTVATEGYAPNFPIAAASIRRRGADLVAAADDGVLPIAGDSFDLVTSRHPVTVNWSEIARVLRPGATYLAQHVGPHSLRELSEWFLGPLPARSKRDPAVERAAAERADLEVRTLREERPRTVFYDVGAVVYFLRLVVWIVPGFSVDRHRPHLRDLHERIQRDGQFETTGSRLLVDAIKPT